MVGNGTNKTGWEKGKVEVKYKEPCEWDTFESKEPIISKLEEVTISSEV